jgi:hypothetical protein
MEKAYPTQRDRRHPSPSTYWSEGSVLTDLPVEPMSSLGRVEELHDISIRDSHMQFCSVH